MDAGAVFTSSRCPELSSIYLFFAVETVWHSRPAAEAKLITKYS